MAHGKELRVPLLDHNIVSFFFSLENKKLIHNGILRDYYRNFALNKFKYNKFIKQIRVENFILLAAIISLIIETIPLRSSGSLFTTNNATYLILIGSIILSYKTILKIKIE